MKKSHRYKSILSSLDFYYLHAYYTDTKTNHLLARLCVWSSQFKKRGGSLGTKKKLQVRIFSTPSLLYTCSIYIHLFILSFTQSFSLPFVCLFVCVDTFSPSTLKSLASDVRVSCGVGLTFRLSIAQIELNYAIPLRAHSNDR